MEHSSLEHSPSSTRTYYIVYVALLILLALTVLVARVDLGGWSVVLALLIAVVKAALVFLYFMHVLHSSRVTKLFIASGFVMLLILFVLLMSDYLSRAWVGV